MFILWAFIKNLLGTIHHYFARFKYRHQNCTRYLIIFHETCQEHNSTRAKLPVINFYRRVAVTTREVRTAYQYTDTEILFGGRCSKNTSNKFIQGFWNPENDNVDSARNTASSFLDCILYVTLNLWTYLLIGFVNRYFLQKNSQPGMKFHDLM